MQDLLEQSAWSTPRACQKNAAESESVIITAGGVDQETDDERLGQRRVEKDFVALEALAVVTLCRGLHWHGEQLALEMQALEMQAPESSLVYPV